MSDTMGSLFQWLNAHPELAGLATFLISAGESIAILGTIVPGSIMMTAIGALAGAGIIPLWATIFWAILGAIVGDGISYWLGHYFKHSLHRSWPFRNYPGLLKSGETFVHKYGTMSVVIGRFVGPVRALVPLAAGMLGMKPLKFTIANIISAIAWAPAYMLPGILLGAAALELPPDIAVHVMMVLLLITLFVLMCLWFIYKILRLIHRQTEQLQNAIWEWLKKSPRLSPLTNLFKHHDPHHTHGQLNLVFYFLFTSIVFLCLAFYIDWQGPPNIKINDTLFHFFRGIRTKGLDDIMIDITLLGQKQIILPVVAVFFGFLIILKRWRLAFHALALGIIAAGSIFVIKHLFQSPRPWGILTNPESYSMPSGHTTLATTVFMGLAFLIAASLPRNSRWPIYVLGLFIAFIVGMSRLYLGAHWFTDVLGAWLLSIAVLIFVIISYERKAEKPIHPIGILVVSLCILAISYGYYHHRNFSMLKKNYQQINWPTAVLSMEEWWEQQEQILPASRVSLFGVASQTINIQWLGDIDQIQQALVKEGWINPPARNWISTLHRIADVKSTQYLPLVSQQYLDKKPEVIMIRHSAGIKNPLVLRLWNSNRTIENKHAILWVGVIGIIPRTYSWLYKSEQRELTADPTLIFPKKSANDKWEWKIVWEPIPKSKHKMIYQKILLLREKK